MRDFENSTGHHVLKFLKTVCFTDIADRKALENSNASTMLWAFFGRFVRTHMKPALLLTCYNCCILRSMSSCFLANARTVVILSKHTSYVRTLGMKCMWRLTSNIFFKSYMACAMRVGMKWLCSLRMIPLRAWYRNMSGSKDAFPSVLMCQCSQSM